MCTNWSWDSIGQSLQWHAMVTQWRALWSFCSLNISFYGKTFHQKWNISLPWLKLHCLLCQKYAGNRTGHQFSVWDSFSVDRISNYIKLYGLLSNRITQLMSGIALNVTRRHRECLHNSVFNQKCKTFDFFFDCQFGRHWPNFKVHVFWKWHRYHLHVNYKNNLWKRWRCVHAYYVFSP